jgi:hypothetical protein
MMRAALWLVLVSALGFALLLAVGIAMSFEVVVGFYVSLSFWATLQRLMSQSWPWQEKRQFTEAS